MNHLAEAPADIVPFVREPMPSGFCDSCGTDERGNYVTRAFYFATVNGTVLAFCVHHANKYETKLLSKATRIRDLRYLMAPLN